MIDTDTVRRVHAASLWAGGVPVRSTDCAFTCCASHDALLHGMSTVWGYLQSEERKAVRATCRNGRQLHDRLTTHLRLTLGKDPGQREVQQQQEQHQPSHTELRVSLGALVRRGARLQLLTLWFRDASDRRREAQLLAALTACSGCPLIGLELEGAVPLSRAVAEAVAACCPHLSNIWLDYRKSSWPTDAVPAREDASKYHFGCGQLLTKCGPRLRVLQLAGVHHWKALSCMALRRCTALTVLELDAGVKASTCGHSQRYLANPAMEAHVFSTVAQLTTLKSLTLLTSFDSASVSPEAVWPHATCVAHLSVLTALTHLRLEVSACYEYQVDSWSAMATDGDQHGAWCEVRAAHRTSLLSALRCMPQLQHLYCRTLWLQPNELAAQTALTSVFLRGLLPQAVGQQHLWQEGRGGLTSLPATGSVPLPTHLVEIFLGTGVSPRALAPLQPSPAFSHFKVQAMVFGISDVDAEGRLRAEAVAAVGPAVRLLTTYRDPALGLSLFSIDGDGSFGLLGPRAGAATGHMEWIRQLRGLDAFGSVAVYNMALQAGDLSCLGQTLSNLTGLKLLGCSFPAVALSLLRNPLLSLRDLTLDFVVEGISSSTLVPLLLALLCSPHTGAAPLTSLTVIGCPNTINAAQCMRSVTEQLEAWFGLTGVALSVDYT